MLPAHAYSLFPRSLLQQALQLFIVNCYMNLQIRTLTNMSDENAVVYWSNADGEEPLNDDAESSLV